MSETSFPSNIKNECVMMIYGEISALNKQLQTLKEEVQTNKVEFNETIKEMRRKLLSVTCTCKDHLHKSNISIRDIPLGSCHICNNVKQTIPGKGGVWLNSIHWVCQSCYDAYDIKELQTSICGKCAYKNVRYYGNGFYLCDRCDILRPHYEWENK